MSVAVGDLGNGHPDILVTNGNTVGVLLNALPRLAVSTIDFISSSSTIVADDSVAFTATLSPTSNPIETGSVSFTDDGQLLGTVQIQSDRTAVFSTTLLHLGENSISANYSGDNNYAASVSTALTVTVASTPPSPVTPFLNQPVFPSSAIAGGKFSARLPIVLTDQGAAMTGVFTIDIFADTGPILDGNQVPLSKSLTRHFALKANGGKSFTTNLRTLPASLADGWYYILVRLTDPTGATSLYASMQGFGVAAPFVDLALSSEGDSFVSSSAAAGDKGSISVTVINNGNIPAKGLVSLNLDLTDTSANGYPLTYKPSTFPLNLLPGKTKMLKVRTAIPSGLPGGSYVFSGSFSTLGALIDSDTTNNTLDFSHVPINLAAGTNTGAVFSNFIMTSHHAAGGILEEEGTVTVPGGFSANYTYFASGKTVTEWQIITSQLFGNSYSFFTNQVTLYHPITTFSHKTMTFLGSKQGATGSLVISDSMSLVNDLAPGTYFFKLE